MHRPLTFHGDYDVPQATGIEDLDASDDLLDLGVDSLMAVKIASVSASHSPGPIHAFRWNAILAGCFVEPTARASGRPV